MPGATFERVYQSLKGRLASGHYAPGAHLDPAAIGEELFASATPVRDGLHCLVGEGIVAASRHDGFNVPRPTEAQLRALYGWRCWLLELALRKAAPPQDVSGGIGGQDGRVEPRSLAGLFLSIAHGTGCEELCAALANASDRLGLFGRGEALLFPDLDDRAEAMAQLFHSCAPKLMRREVSGLHRRFQRRVPELLEAAIRSATIVE